ncbi:MAG: formate/nitrite transporter family protein [Rhizobiaceae bacterium]
MTSLHKPSEIADLVENAGVAKAAIPFHALVILSVLAGAFIAFGSAFYLMSMTGADLGYGPSRVLGGMVFSLGLILVVIGGAELFTGNALIVMAYVDKRISTAALLRNWTIVWCGNFVGALLIALAFAQTGLIEAGFGQTAAKVATAKMALGPLDIFVRAILCNALVCLAVWLSFAATDVAGKILSIIMPVAAFVALGLEHSIANMFMLPLGLIAGAEGSPVLALQNILIATAGNIAGGAGGVALAYRFAFKPQV